MFFFHSMYRTYHLFVEQFRMSLFCVQQSITRPLLFWTWSIRRFDLHKVWNRGLMPGGERVLCSTFNDFMCMQLWVSDETGFNCWTVQLFWFFSLVPDPTPFTLQLGVPEFAPPKKPAGMTTAPSLKVWAWHPWHPTARFTLKAWDTRRRVQQASDLVWGSASRVPRRKMAEKITLRDPSGGGRRW